MSTKVVSDDEGVAAATLSDDFIDHTDPKHFVPDITPSSWANIVASTLEHISPGTTIKLKAVEALSRYVETEVVYMLRDAHERRVENGGGAINSKNIVGALETYSRYRDEDVFKEFKEVQELWQQPL